MRVNVSIMAYRLYAVACIPFALLDYAEQFIAGLVCNEESLSGCRVIFKNGRLAFESSIILSDATALAGPMICSPWAIRV